jgi:hypothetical protein
MLARAFARDLPQEGSRMPAKTKTSKSKKTVKDLKPKKNPKGGINKAGKGTLHI